MELYSAIKKIWFQSTDMGQIDEDLKQVHCVSRLELQAEALW